jgi:hypothetical protein
MKYCIILVVWLLTLNSLFGQSTKCCIPFENGKDTAFWYKWSGENAEKIGLEDLTQTNDSLHFRFWTETKSVDVWTKDFKFFSGFLTLYTESIPKDVNSLSKGKFYSKKILLDDSTAKNVYLLFDSLAVFSIPPQEDIKGWENGNDGDIFLIEYSTPNTYSFKSYWTPSNYPNIKEAFVIDTLSKQLDKMLAMGNRWSKFIRSLPKGSYNAGGATVILTDITVRKKK